MKENDLRNEYRKLKLSGELAASLGCTCSNCGSSENIEYHHIVPLHLGGTNRLTNIVPLCNRCHQTAHRGRHISHYVSHAGGGRPPKCSDEEAFKALDLLVDGRIGNIKCREMMNLSEKTWPTMTSQFKRWKEARGIESMRSNLDSIITNSTRTLSDGDVIGWIKYRSSGKKEPIRYKGSCDNDIKYAKRSSSSGTSKVSDEIAFEALDMWADGQIGTSKLLQLMCVKSRNCQQYERWLESRRYRHVKNTLDYKAATSRKGIDEKTVVGRIIHDDWSSELIYFHDTGKNDDVVYALSGRNGEAAFSEIKNMMVNNPIIAALYTIESSGQMKFEFV